MNLSFVRTALLKGQHLSPTVMTYAGVAGIVTAGVLACRATIKAQPVTELIKENRALISELHEKNILSDQEHKKALTQHYTAAAVSYVKLYALPIAIGAVSICAVAGGHSLLMRRNAVLGAALTATEKAFKEYRKSVVNEIGADREKELRYGVEDIQIHDTEAGTVTSVTTVDTTRSPYTRFFDELNPNWEPNAMLNKMFLSSQQDYANKKLNAQGWLLLNDVYESLGMDKTSAGAIVGWVISENGDNFVDFNVYDFTSEAARAFVNEDERAILLDFNVDGPVWQLIDEMKRN